MTTAGQGAFRQLALGLQWRDASAFENFLVGRNREAVERARASVTAAASEPRDWLVLWGEPGSGKTHLLEAVCHAAAAIQKKPIYISLRDHASLSPSIFDDIEQFGPVCVDDVDAIAGQPDWERSLFALYERMCATGGALLVAARSNPASLGFGLRDLATRLNAGLVYQLQLLNDSEKIAALRLRAERRGIEMSEEVAKYLLARYPRDTHSLFALLDRLDIATLVAQRRLTVPFLKSLD